MNQDLSNFSDIVDTFFDEGGGGSNPRCDWQWWVCQEPPNYSLVTGHDIESRNADFFCTRHFILTVRHLHDVHLKMCPHPLSDHIFSYNEI